MSIEQRITLMVDRLKRADIPVRDLAYLVDEEEWRDLTRYLERISVHRGIDLTYATDIEFMGMAVKKRRAVNGSAEQT